MKWCLANQVDWSQFQEGKQLINNIPGQLAFSDKINLWYTIKDYLHNIINECERVANVEPKIEVTFFEGITVAAFLAFSNPQPKKGSGPSSPPSSAVWQASPFKVAALMKLLVRFL